MEHFDSISYANELNRYRNYLPALNSLIDNFNSLDIGVFSERELDQIFKLSKSDFKAFCEERIKEDAIQQVDKLGITKQKLKQKFIQDSISDELETLKDLGSFPYNLKRKGYELEGGKAFFDQSFESVLEELYTTKPETDNQKKVAELIETICTAIGELSPLVGKRKIIGYRNESIKPFIRMKGNEIDFVFTEHLKNIR
jgi:hypothetical protein